MPPPSASWRPVLPLELDPELRSLNFRQVLVHELNDDGAFADAGSDALHRAMPHIAYDKNSRHVGLQQTRIAIVQPGQWPLHVAMNVRTDNSEAALVAIDARAEQLHS